MILSGGAGTIDEEEAARLWAEQQDAMIEAAMARPVGPLRLMDTSEMVVEAEADLDTHMPHLSADLLALESPSGQNLIGSAIWRRRKEKPFRPAKKQASGRPKGYRIGSNSPDADADTAVAAAEIAAELVDPVEWLQSALGQMRDGTIGNAGMGGRLSKLDAQLLSNLSREDFAACCKALDKPGDSHTQAFAMLSAEANDAIRKAFQREESELMERTQQQRQQAQQQKGVHALVDMLTALSNEVRQLQNELSSGTLSKQDQEKVRLRLAAIAAEREKVSKQIQHAKAGIQKRKSTGRRQQGRTSPTASVGLGHHHFKAVGAMGNEQLAALMVATLTKNDLAEMRSFVTPPQTIRTLLETVCAVLGAKPTWSAGQKLMKRADFVRRLIDRLNESPLSADGLSSNSALRDRLRRFVDNEALSVERVARVSVAAQSLCRWLHSIAAQSGVEAAA